MASVIELILTVLLGAVVAAIIAFSVGGYIYICIWEAGAPRRRRVHLESDETFLRRGMSVSPEEARERWNRK